MSNQVNKLNIKLEVKTLMHALNFANSVVEKRNVLAELSHIKLIALDNKLEIIATDMDLSLLQEIPSQIFEPGQTIVPSSMFTDIIRKIPDKEISLRQEANSQQLEILGENCRFELITLPSNKFPIFEDIQTNSLIKIPCKEFTRLIDYTQFSMSNEETRYNLNGIYLHNNKDKEEIYMAATDGHRLSVASSDTKLELEEFGIILPRKTIQEISKIIKDSHNIDSELQIQISTNKVKFLCNNVIMISKVIDGTFPPYANLIPVGNSNKLEINSKLLADAIDRVATITVDKFKAVKIILRNDSIEISASGEDKGSAKEKLTASEEKENKLIYQGDELTIGFNPRYLLDVLGAVKQDNIEIYFNDASSPALIKIPNRANDNFVIMPVKI